VRLSDGNVNSPPSRHEAEISIFGPGIGECIVIHLGENAWIIVDSCLDRNTRTPIALQYLQALGVNTATDVKLFVITHWHDDHIEGASAVLSSCHNAKFVCSDALRSEEFVQFVRLYSQRGFIENSGVDEFNRIFEVLKTRSGYAKPELLEPGWAIADRRLLYYTKNHLPSNVEVYSLSPSDAAITLALREIGQLLIPKVRTPKRRAIAQRPNHVSVALWVMIGDLHVLLGSDLENHPDNRLGWQAVVLSANRPHERALVIKVPHHESSNAYCKDMWEEMASSNPIALITPFASGVKPLPAETDIARIRAHTSQIYCTGSPSGWRSPRRDSTVDKTIKEFVRTRRLVYGPMGHVRVRIAIKKSLDESNIELFNGAQLI